LGEAFVSDDIIHANEVRTEAAPRPDLSLQVRTHRLFTKLFTSPRQPFLHPCRAALNLAREPSTSPPVLLFTPPI
jgi:hypothetical protein